MEGVFSLEGKTLEEAELYLMNLCEPIGDMEKLRSLFDIWTTRAGVGYMRVINSTSCEDYPPDWTDPEVIAKWIPIRNLFTCESHAYLLRQLGFLIESGKFNEAAAKYDEIAKLQAPEFVTW
jgi:hypothetical protein